MKKLKTVNTVPWDSAAYLENDDDIAAYLEAVLEENDPVLLNHALGIVAKAKGMSYIAKETGLARESLYRALTKKGNPEFSTILKVIKALGLRLHIEAGEDAPRNNTLAK